MIEKQLEDRMHAALLDEPPLGFDPDEVVDRAVRRRRQRRTALAAAAGAAGVLALAATTAVVTGVSRHAAPSGGPSDTWQPPARCGPVTGDATEHAAERSEVFPGSDALIARLRAAEPRLLTKHFPAMSFDPPDGLDFDAVDCPPSLSMARYVSGGEGEWIRIDLVHRLDHLDPDGYIKDPHEKPASDTVAEDGARILVYRERGNQGTIDVVRLGPDGMITEVSATNPTTLTITQDQLIGMASDPELRFPLPR